MITVHHLNDSRSERILLLLEELEISYEIKKYTRSKEQRAPKELEAIHPLGKAPVITDSDGNVTLAESGAIIQYLIEKYGKGRADASGSGKIDDLYFTHYCEGSLMPLLVNRLVFSLAPSQAPFFVRPLVRFILGQLTAVWLDPQIKTNFEFIENHLQRVHVASPTSSWTFCGGANLTAADYMMSFPLEAFAAAGGQKVPPGIQGYLDMLKDRPAYKKALERGGQYSYAMN